MRTTGKRYIACSVCSEETTFTYGESVGISDLHLNSLVEGVESDGLNQTDAYLFDVRIDEERDDWPEFVSMQLAVHKNDPVQ